MENLYPPMIQLVMYNCHKCTVYAEYIEFIETLWIKHIFNNIYCYFTYIFCFFIDLHYQFKSTTVHNCVKKLTFSNISMYKIKYNCVKIFTILMILGNFYNSYN